MEHIKWIDNQLPKSNDDYLSIMSPLNVEKAKKFHESFPQYKETPLIPLKSMANFLSLNNIFVKDESYRFGLNAFKVLGGSFAIARYIAEKTHRDMSELTYNFLTSQKLKDEFGEATFFTATDGNHGRGVAWAANKLGQNAVVYMPKGTTKTRLENIKKENATATIEDVNYDDCVRMAATAASKTPNGIIVQDTAWEGYEDVPAWIMQGYGTMAMEASSQLQTLGVQCPTHIFVQAGVGSLAGAIQGYFANLYGENCPTTVIVESNMADCIYRSATNLDGSIIKVDGDMKTIMAGLACGEPNTLSWDILRNHSAFFISVPDWVAAKGMRMLSSPLKGDKQIISGESGAVTMGLLVCIMKMDEYTDLKTALNLDENSKVLLFSTEGDTDPDRYKEIVWNGLYKSY